ncbi:SRPBCC domain-containing protein [Rhodococcus sp. IEGM 1307]|uniref:SRPBCC domain-containing protein n=1 Tax=Rhodococcus sp. IEGM 1307 TaxID=3047091 RepID=UPI0024B7D0B5|nr:SRPBCC domain-containing protein [Rhodococcus sp. IEGM 1307]MDI9979416.1 SRPBCC domain-containing protein [Rhodococcus sp. IEGM 1307]
MSTCLLDGESVEAWLPPDGMRGRVDRSDPRPGGGGFRMVLTYLEPAGSPGKTSDGTDVVEVEFAELVPAERVVFEADDPSYAGTMTMTGRLVAAGGGTEVTVTATYVSPGIDQVVHEAGIASALANLATYVEGELPDPTTSVEQVLAELNLVGGTNSVRPILLNPVKANQFD